MSAHVESPLSWRDRTIVALLCSVAWLPVTFVRGGYSWDDWVLATGTPSELREWNLQLGRVVPLSTEAFILFGATGVRLLTVCSLIATGLALLKIGASFQIFRREELLFLAVFSSINPVDTSKSLLVTASYSWSVAFFYVGWSCLLSRRYWPAAFPLMLISFDTNSLLVFAIVPLIDLIFRGRNNRQTVNKVKILGLSLSVLLYATVRFFVRRPSGTYEGYNSPGVLGLLFVTFSVAGVATLAFALFKAEGFAHDVRAGAAVIAALGVLLMTIAVVPYIALGYIPPYFQTFTRHYLLIGLGLGVTLVGIARALRSFEGQRPLARRSLPLLLFLAISFTWSNAFLSIHFWRDIDLIQREVAAADLSEKGLVLVNFADTPASQISRRFGPNYSFRWYEWTLALNAQEGRENMTILESDYAKYLEGKLANAYGSESVFWGVEGFEPSTTAIRLEVESVGGFLGFFADYEVSASEIQVELPRG